MVPMWRTKHPCKCEAMMAMFFRHAQVATALAHANGFCRKDGRQPLAATTLRTLTSLNKEVRPFFLSDNSIWSFPSVSSLSDCSIWRS